MAAEAEEGQRSMQRSIGYVVLAASLACADAVVTVWAQQATLTPEQREQRWQTEKELQSAGIIERKVMMPMRDGVRLATDIYRPKNASGKVPTIWVRTPYNFNFWDVHNGVPADMSAMRTEVKRGDAEVVRNRRGACIREVESVIRGAARPPRQP